MRFLKRLEQPLTLALGLLGGLLLRGDDDALGVLGNHYLFFRELGGVLQVAQGLGRPAQALGQFAGALQPRLALVPVMARLVPGAPGLLEVGGRLVAQHRGYLGFALGVEVSTPTEI